MQSCHAAATSADASAPRIDSSLTATLVFVIPCLMYISYLIRRSG